jgi:hypothetical protein
MAHAYNPSYSGAQIERNVVRAHYRFAEPLTSWYWTEFQQ